MEEKEPEKIKENSGRSFWKVCDWKNCEYCGKNHFMAYKVIKLIIVAIILLLIFGLGVKIGEIKNNYGGFYGRGYSMMGRRGNNFNSDFVKQQYRNGCWDNSTSSQAIPQTQ